MTEPSAKFIRNGETCSLTYTFPNDAAWENEDRVHILLDVFVKAGGATVTEIARLEPENITHLLNLHKQAMTMPEDTRKVE